MTLSGAPLKRCRVLCWPTGTFIPPARRSRCSGNQSARLDDRPRRHSQIRGVSSKSAKAFAAKRSLCRPAADVLAYIQALWETVCTPEALEAQQVQRLKKFMNYIGEGVGPGGQFLHEIRRVTTKADFFAACERHLDHDRPMPLDRQMARSRRFG